MRSSRFDEHQIAGALRQAKAGIPVGEVCESLGVSRTTFYGWRSRYGGMDPSALIRMRQLEEDNGRLKQRHAALAEEHSVLKVFLGKLLEEGIDRRELVRHVTAEHGVSERHACRMLGLSRSVYRYRRRSGDDTEVVDALTRLADLHPAFGFRRLFRLLRAAGRPWNRKRVWRVYCTMGLNLRHGGASGDGR